jgi:hypothetical protein
MIDTRVLVALDLGGASGLLQLTREVCANCVEKICYHLLFLIKLNIHYTVFRSSCNSSFFSGRGLSRELYMFSIFTMFLRFCQASFVLANNL